MGEIKKGIKIFKRFLKEQGIYALFLREVSNNKAETSTINKKFGGNLTLLLQFYGDRPEVIFDKSLRWDKTDQGSSYWAEMTNKFADYYDKQKRV